MPVYSPPSPQYSPPSPQYCMFYPAPYKYEAAEPSGSSDSLMFSEQSLPSSFLSWHSGSPPSPVYSPSSPPPQQQHIPLNIHPPADEQAIVQKPTKLTADERIITGFVHAFIDKAKNEKNKNKANHNKWATEYPMVAASVWALLTNVVVTLPTAGAGKKTHFMFRQLSCILTQGEYATVDELMKRYKAVPFADLLLEMGQRYYMADPPKKHLVAVKAALLAAGFKMEPWSKEYEQYYVAQQEKECAKGKPQVQQQQQQQQNSA
jgi:hypothetical protein